MSLAPGLLEILACPRCKGRLIVTSAGDGLGCSRCRVAYPVTDDIPVMIFEESVPWTPAAATGPGPAGPGRRGA
jgi:uncharacterized protein YbaR (Trm112 family)